MITPGTCEHLRTVLDALTRRDEQRRSAYRLRAAYLRGDMEKEDFYGELAERAEDGDIEAQWVYDITRADDAQTEGPLFPERAEETDLAKELFG